MEKIGFIGLGIMGKPMALHLLKAGYPVAVLEKNKAAGELLEAGAEAFPDSQSIARYADVIITMLPDSPQVMEVVTGADGILEGIRKGALFIDMSTIAPATAKEIYQALQKKGVEALDTPVSGGQVGATTATLSIMVGGSEPVFNVPCPCSTQWVKTLCISAKREPGK